MISFDKTPVEYLDLSRRAMNVLKRMNVTHLDELVRLSASDLLSCRNCGKRTVAEIQYKLAKLGLSLQNPLITRRFTEAMRIVEEIKRLKQTIATLRAELRRFDATDAQEMAAERQNREPDPTARRIAELRESGKSYREISRELDISPEWCRKKYLRFVQLHPCKNIDSHYIATV